MAPTLDFLTLKKLTFGEIHELSVTLSQPSLVVWCGQGGEARARLLRELLAGESKRALSLSAGRFGGLAQAYTGELCALRPVVDLNERIAGFHGAGSVAERLGVDLRAKKLFFKYGTLACRACGGSVLDRPLGDFGRALAEELTSESFQLLVICARVELGKLSVLGERELINLLEAQGYKRGLRGGKIETLESLLASAPIPTSARASKSRKTSTTTQQSSFLLVLDTLSTAHELLGRLDDAYRQARDLGAHQIEVHLIQKTGEQLLSQRSFVWGEGLACVLCGAAHETGGVGNGMDALRLRGAGAPSLGEFLSLTVSEAFAVSQRYFSSESSELVTELAAEPATVAQQLAILAELGLDRISLGQPCSSLSSGELLRLVLAELLFEPISECVMFVTDPGRNLSTTSDRNFLLLACRKLMLQGNLVLISSEHSDLIDAADTVFIFERNALLSYSAREGISATVGLTVGSTVGSAALHAQHQPAESVKSGPFLPLRKASNFYFRHPRGVSSNLTLIDQGVILISGVSGSGKTSFLEQFQATARGRKLQLKGWTSDRKPSGALPLTQTLLSLFDLERPIAERFAGTAEARRAGLTENSFKLTSIDGRCENCRGTGFQNAELELLGVLRERCDSCLGSGFSARVSTVQYDGAAVGEVLRYDLDRLLKLFNRDAFLSESFRSIQQLGFRNFSLRTTIQGLSSADCVRAQLGRRLMPGVRRSRQELFVFDQPLAELGREETRHLLELFRKMAELGALVVVSSAPESFGLVVNQSLSLSLDGVLSEA